MKAIALTLLLGAALILLVLKISGATHWTIGDLTALIGLIAVAAGVVALIPMHSSKARCKVVEAWYEYHGRSDPSSEMWQFTVSARITNVGEATDNLEQLICHVSKGKSKVDGVAFVAGARPFVEETGKVLPFPVAPNSDIMVQATGNLAMRVSEMERLVADPADWRLELRFVFTKSRAQKVTLSSSAPNWTRG